MDVNSYLAFATAIGLAAGFIIGHFFGNTLLWTFFSVAFMIATNTTWQTIRNNRGQRRQQRNTNFQRSVDPIVEGLAKKIKPPKPTKPHF